MNSRKKFLYRYYGNQDYLMDVLKNKRLYHCLPTEFNDPFDCRPLISLKHSKQGKDETWRKLFYYLAKMQYQDLPDSELRKHADAAFENGLHKNESWLQDVDEALKTVGSLVRVCCFAKSARNMMMWAHYAKNHTGIVLQFRTLGLKDAATHQFRGMDVTYISKALGVEEYVHSLERGLDHGDVLAMARIIYSTKTDHWEREDEVRFFTANDREFLSFGEQALSGIIFGAECPKNIMEEVEEAVRGWHHRPLLFKASIDKSTHKLWIGTRAPNHVPRAGEPRST
jgi:hypothetical protein